MRRDHEWSWSNEISSSDRSTSRSVATTESSALGDRTALYPTWGRAQVVTVMRPSRLSISTVPLGEKSTVSLCVWDPGGGENDGWAVRD